MQLNYTNRVSTNTTNYTNIVSKLDKLLILKVKDLREKAYNISETTSILNKIPSTVISSKGNVINIKDDIIRHTKVILIL